LKNLGGHPLCLGFNYNDNGRYITQALDEWGVSHDFVMVTGAVRTNIKLYDSSTGKMTELNQPGHGVPAKALAKLHAKIMTAWEENSVLVLSGSMPGGVPADFYKALCEDWPGNVILDTEGEALELAMKGARPPFCIKPNLYELESAFGVTFSSKEEIAVFCTRLIKAYKVKMICVSMGSDGAVLVTESAAYSLDGLELKVQGLQGAGDAMVAGLAYGLFTSTTEPELLRIASAAAAATVVREGTLMCTKIDYEWYLDKLPKPIVINKK